ncbi:MAG: tetratricopeptide (TPR) repeat protein [Paraglaciecola sp.]|jgi:tetratricopeptide (TPR) repeat protein
MTFTKSLSKFGIVALLTAPSLAATSFSSLAAENFNSQLLNLQQSWAKVNYQLTDDTQKVGFEDLLKQAKELVAANPDNANSLVWLGIIESSYAGAKGGIGALSLAKKAKKVLEASMKIDDSALDGSAYASLGTLYHKVPGWPLSFGDDDTAKEMLEKAMLINPDGIDSNYFYGEFLFDEKQYTKAKQHLTHALQAAAREERPVADEFRRVEINQLMAKVDKKINKH